MGRGVRSNRITGAVIGAAWGLVALLILLGNVLNRGSGKGYERPTPVNTFYSILSFYFFADGFYSAVLVLDWGTLPQMGYVE